MGKQIAKGVKTFPDRSLINQYKKIQLVITYIGAVIFFLEIVLMKQDLTFVETLLLIFVHTIVFLALFYFGNIKVYPLVSKEYRLNKVLVVKK